jgi:O-antigen/teichoic acid export membrane protein
MMKKNLAFYSILFVSFLLLQRGSGVLTKIVLANSITPYEYGLITLLALTVPSILQIFSNLNFYQMLSHSTEGKEYFGFSIVVSSLLMATISILLILFSEPFFEYLNVPTDQQPLFLFVILIIMWSQGVLVDFQGLFAGLRLYSVPGIILTLPSVIRLLAVVVLMISKTISLTAVLLVFGLSSLVPLAYIVSKSRYRELCGLMKVIKLPEKSILAFGTTIFMMSSVSVIGQYLVRIVLSHELGLEWQGYFDVSLTLIALIIFGLSTIDFVSVPEATGNEQGNLYDKGGLSDIARLLFAFALITAAILYFYADYIVIVFFSKDYLPASDYILILALGYIFLFVQVLITDINLAQAKDLKEFRGYLILSLILIPAFFFIPQYSIRLMRAAGYGNGFLGAYVSFCCILIAFTLFTVLLARDRRPVKTLLMKFERLGLSLLIPSLIIFLTNPPPLAGIFILLIGFTLLVFWSGYLDRSIILDIFGTHDA